jgi:thiosulfate reductase cytochrome b subunit
MRLLPLVLPSERILRAIHPSLPACLPVSAGAGRARVEPNESPFALALEPTLVADDWVPFLVLWHVWWPYLLVTRWWAGKRWTRVSGPKRDARLRARARSG